MNKRDKESEIRGEWLCLKHIVDSQHKPKEDGVHGIPVPGLLLAIMVQRSISATESSPAPGIHVSVGQSLSSFPPITTRIDLHWAHDTSCPLPESPSIESVLVPMPVL